MRRILVLLVMLTAFTSHAIAHEILPSIATLKFLDDKQFSLKISLNLEAQLAEIGPEHDETDEAPNAVIYNGFRKLAPAELVSKFRVKEKIWLENLGLTFGGKVPEAKIDEVLVPDVGDIEVARESTLNISGTVPSGATTLNWAFPQERGSSVLRIERPGQELQAQFFAAGAKSDAINISTAEPRSFIAKVIDYGVIGFTHILPKGLDHILFVLGLFLLSVNWKPLIAQVTAFTLAHSVTLALGLYGVVNIAPSIVEPLIALSIVYVAVENIFTKVLHSWRIVIVFLFGLLHGLGFAGILTEIGLPRSDFVLGLVSFNVGVELGQLTVIALAFAVVGWAVKKPWYRQRIVIPASLAIAAMGAWWVVERTLL